MSKVHFRRGSGLAVGLFLLGCSCSDTPQFCVDYPGFGTTLGTQFGSCDAGAGLTIQQATGTSDACPANVCSAAFNRCSASDQAYLLSLKNCVRSQPTCTPGQEGAWFRMWQGCLSDGGGGTSQYCSFAFGGSADSGYPCGI
jgi:hypothetical protein